MATFASGSIHFSGLGSDTDFDTMINNLYQVESLHAQQLLKWKKDWSARLEAFGDLRTSLVTMQTELKKLSGVGNFLAKTYTSTRPEVSSATIGPDAEARDYSLNVTQIATSSIASCETTLLEKNSAISTTNGTLSITMGSKTIDVNITGGSTSLEGLVKLINNHPDNTEKGSSGTTQPLVKASLVKSNNGYIVQIRSFETGADRVFSVETTGAEKLPQGGLWGTALDSSYSPGQNAKFFVDGIGTEIISSTNTVTDVVEGVTFNLRSIGDTTITVSNDIDTIKENITKFVDAVNAVRSKLAELTAYNSEKIAMAPEIADTQNEMQKGSILTGNYGVQLIASQLKSICGSGAKGFDYFNATTNSGDIFSALSQIGITTDANQGSDTYGLLVINDVPSDKSSYGTLSLDEALAKDLAGIGRLFAAKNEVVVTGSSAFGFESFTFTESIRPGIYDVSYEMDTDGVTCLGATIGGYPASYNPVERTLLVTSPKDSPVYGLQLSLYDLSEGTHSGKVNVRQGKIDELLTALEAPGSERTGILEKGYQLKEEKIHANGYKETIYTIVDRGSLAILEENYKSIMANIDQKVLKENTRLETWERRMRNKFARLEATLARYNAINDSMASQIKSLSTNSSK